jgi:hypothetical protein
MVRLQCSIIGLRPTLNEVENATSVAEDGGTLKEQNWQRNSLKAWKVYVLLLC